MKAKAYLEKEGYVVLEQNFRVQKGEIDIIARDGEYLVFVEVKYRKNMGCGFPEEAVDYRKQRTICRVSDFYRMKHGIAEVPIRYDVISDLNGEIKLIKNAFSYVPINS